MLFTSYSTVADFVATQPGGCKVALIDPQGHILTPSVDLTDYPGLAQQQVVKTGPDACITDGPLALHALVRHCGQLDYDYQHHLPYHPVAA